MIENERSLSVNDLGFLIEERINRPVTGLLYERFVQLGLNNKTESLLGDFSNEEVAPVIYTLCTHITKEKPVFVYEIGRSLDLGEEEVSSAAVVVDVLWSLSLMMDDIIDDDLKRAGRDSTWVKFGKERTDYSAHLVLDKILNSLKRVYGNDVEKVVMNSIDKAMSSLSSSQVRDFNSEIDNLEDNIDQRADFHCALPAFLLCKNMDERQDFQDILFLSNRAGQVVNDLKDIVSSSIYGRDIFSDIRGGTLTIPLLFLRENVDGIERGWLEDVFGSGSLSEKEREWLFNLVRDNLPRERIFNYVNGQYELFLSKVGEVVDVDRRGIFKMWSDYKKGQLKMLLTDEK